MKVLVTGNKGYIGNVLVSLMSEKFDVVGFDSTLYPQEFIIKNGQNIHTIKKDIRNVTKEDLKGFDAVIHLAGLSNDPMGEINPALTDEINFHTTVKLAKFAKTMGISKFIFSSSCSTYGVNSDIVNENSTLSPQTAYAKSKVESEKELLKLQDTSFSPVILRNATVYGVSPSLRLDLVVNNLTCCAFTTGVVKLLSDGTAWRPLIHVEDVSNAFIQCLLAKDEDVSGEIFNVGSNSENYKVKEIAKLVEDTVPDSKIEYASSASKDSRSYRVDFSKINSNLGFETKWTVGDGVKELYKVFSEKCFTKNDFVDKNFYRVQFLKSLLDSGKINSSLYLQ